MNRRFVGVCLGVLLVGCFWRLCETRAIPATPNTIELERAAAEGLIQNLAVDGDSVSVWAKDFESAEPAMAACDCEIRLMRGREQVGTYTKRAGIQLRGMK